MNILNCIRLQCTHNQYKLIHRRMVNNQLLQRMGILFNDKCLYCNDFIETFEHIYIQCENTSQIWNDTEKWVREIYDSNFKISGIEKIFGCMDNNQITQLIIITVKDIIYQRRKRGKNGYMWCKKIFTKKYEYVEVEWNDEKQVRFIWYKLVNIYWHIKDRQRYRW